MRVGGEGGRRGWEVRVGGEGGRREWCIMYVSMCECVGSYQATEMYEAFMLY